jgi:hypothetical protein
MEAEAAMQLSGLREALRLIEVRGAMDKKDNLPV